MEPPSRHWPTRLLGLARREPLLTALLLGLALLITYEPSLAARLPRLVDWDAVALIIILMMASRGLEYSGFIEWAAARIAYARPQLFLLACAGIAALAMNDASLFVLAPLSSAVARASGAGEAEMVVLAVIAVNLGSSLTPIGNPQNIIIWRHYGLGFAEFTVAVAKMLLPVLLLYTAYATLVLRRRRPPPPAPLVRQRRALAVSSLLVVLLAVVSEELWRPILLAPIVVLFYLLAERRVLGGLDPSVPATIALMYMVFRGLAMIIPHSPPRGPLETLVQAIALSQLVSNVPATLLLLGAPWKPLLLGVSIGGIGLVTGSLANIIALRITGTRLRDYHRIALPFFAAATLLAAAETALTPIQG